MDYFWRVIPSFNKRETKAYCMDFHLKFNMKLFIIHIYLNVIEFIFELLFITANVWIYKYN